MTQNHQSTQAKWDEKYQAANLHTPANPCFALQEHSKLLPFHGRALEVACGLGGNARFLAQCGLKVDAWDISDNALTVLNNWASINQLPITPLITDLEAMILPYQQFDVIVVSRYLDRKLFPQLVDALKPKGLLIYQTFLAPVQENAPKNPTFYVKSGELSQSFSKLQTLVYGEGWLTSENQPNPSNRSANADNSKQRYAWFIGRKP